MSFLSNHYDLELTKFLNKSIDYNHKLLVRIKAGLPPEEFSETSESTLQLEATDEKCITIPIVLVSNEDYSVPACVTIQSILMQKDINIAYNFIFMTDESLTEESKSIITDIVNAHSRASIRFLNVRELFSAIPFDTDISHLTKNVLFYVLMTPVLLLEYDNCLYMDVDIAVQGSLYDLYNINLDEYYVAAVPSLTVQHDDINYGDYHNVINIPDKKQYVNTGVMVMNLEAMRRDNLVHRFIEVTRNRPGRWYFQDAINIVCYGKILLLPLKYNVTAYEKLWERDTKDFLDVSPFYEQTEFEEAKDKPVIFHYVSRYKPWFSHLAYKSHYWYSALFSGSHMEKVYFRMRHKHQNISSNTGVKHSKIPRISVIVSVFNNVEYLERCIDSIINQTFKSLQIIIINDGSTDERVPSILNKYTAADERVRVIHKENAGSAAARNHGIELSQANYIAFVESDDYIAPTMYEKLYNLAESYKTDIVKCNFYQCFSKITRETNFFSKLGKTGVKFTLLERPKIYGLHASIWASLYRRSYLNDNSIRFIETPKATYSDFSWMVKTYATAKNIVVCAFHLYFYNYENPNSSFRAEDENCFYKPYHCDKAIDTLLEMSIFNEVHKYITPAIFRTCLGHAQYIRENLREEYFLKFRNVILKLKANGEDFSCLDKKSKILTDLLLKDDKNGFYNKVLRINNDYVFKETLVKLADKSIVFRIPYKVYQLGKRIILFPFNFHYVIERILLRVWKSRHEKNFKYALLKLASKCVCIVGLLIVAFFIMFVFMFLRLFGII
jgi:lipopolysaccharide biosynthesis glycosyltransferase